MADGLPELFNKKGKMLEYGKVSKIVMKVVYKSPQEILDHLHAASSSWLNGSSQDDDMTSFVFRRKLRQDEYDTRIANKTNIAVIEEMEPFL